MSKIKPESVRRPHALDRLTPSAHQQSLTTASSLISDQVAVSRVTLCEDNHRVLKSHEAAWGAAEFGGYRRIGRLLGEVRDCPACGSSILRLVPFTDALASLLECLLPPHQPGEVHIQSARMLISWAQANLSDELGVTIEAPLRPLASSHAVSGDIEWQNAGRELRERRERAGLTRAALSALTGIADSTIRNYETGRHRPRSDTLHRVLVLPALQSGAEGNNLNMKDRQEQR